MIHATLSWKGFDRAAYLQRFTEAQADALQEIQPILMEILTTTVGTQYYDLKTLRKMGHPYSIGGHAPLPLGIINKQSGRFLEAMRIIGPTRIGDLVVLQLINMDEERAWQLKGGGDSRMPPRPYKVLLQDRLRRQAAQKLTAALVKVKVAA